MILAILNVVVIAFPMLLVLGMIISKFESRELPLSPPRIITDAQIRYADR